MRLCDVAGLSYDTTSSLSSALNYPVVLFATRVQATTFNSSEKQQIKDYTSNGGVLIISSLRDEDLFDVAGVSSATSANTNFKLTWDIDAIPEVFHLIDDSLEKTISLGRETNGSTFFSRHYTLNGATALGRYQNDSIAALFHDYGNGRCYVFGPDFREMIYRNMIDADMSAHRTYSNGFEPTSDVLCFWIRNIVRKHIPHTIYKYTIPHNAKSVVFATHDIDSRTAMDTMQHFSDYELAHGIPGHYNVTTRYFNDALMSNFYIGTASLITDIINDGHRIASHSVGHFPDYADADLFPYGTLGNTFADYHPEHFGGATSGGTVLGELEVSKGLLELDHNIHIKSFRAGHLAYPDSLGMGLLETGYQFNSTHSANNILTSYPYYIPYKQSFTTPITNVLELPMTISDVFASDPINEENFDDKVDIWIEATKKYTDNHSPINLLIHPNRGYKLTAQMNYFDNLPTGCIPFDFEEYGNYWRKRDSLKFYSSISNDTMYVFFENDSWADNQSFVIDDNGLDIVRFFDFQSNEITFNSQSWDFNQTLYYYGAPINTVEEISLDPEISVYPVPSNNVVYLNSSEKHESFELFDTYGRLVHRIDTYQPSIVLNKNTLQLKNGLYFGVFKYKNGHAVSKKIIWE